MSKNNYNTISQFYKSDKTLNHNPPFGITPFYTLGPKPYSLCPEQTGSFQIPPYKLHQKSYDQKFNKHLLFTNLVKDILFINLTHRTDRYQNIHSQFQNLPFDLTRINATNNPTFPALGCSQSHINALLYAKNNNLSNAMIIEDDFQWTINKNTIVPIFNHLYNFSKNNDWDVIMLCFNKGQIKQTNTKYIYKIKDTQVATAYIVNQKYYDTLINNLKNGNNMLKKHGKESANKYANDQCWKSLQEKDNWYAFYPMTVKQLDSFSDIENKNKNYNLKPSN